MTFLPIVERELRVAARRGGTYWMRLLVAAGAIAIGVVVYLSSLVAPPVKFGKTLFWALGGLALLMSLFAGRRSTADCISEEKREGTLGLLFLTDLKGYDVVSGKLVANSLGAFYGLLAVFPVLAMPLLVGGMTNGEFWRMVLVLLDTFLYSLAIGIFVSSLTRDVRTAMGTNFLLLLILAAVLPVLWAALAYYHSTGPPAHFVPFFSCPIYPFVLSDDALYRMRPADYWISVGEIHALTWAMVLSACWIVPRSWQDRQTAVPRSRKMRWRQFWHAFSYGPVAGRAAFRKQSLDVNAYYWLAGRARLKPLHVWLFLGMGVLWWLVGWWLAGDLWLDDSNPVVTALVLNVALKLWIAPEAAQQMSEDRQKGAMELLLSTPLGVRDMVHGQWLALRRQFVKPVLVVLAVELVFMLVILGHEHKFQVLAFWLAGMIMLPADMLALGWVAMGTAQTAKTPSKATFHAIWRVLITPWLLFGAASLVVYLWAELFSDADWRPGWFFYLSLWFGAGLLCDVVYGLQARQLLRTHVRLLASENRALVVSTATQLVEQKKKVGGPTPGQPRPEPAQPRRRRWKWAVAALLVVALVLSAAWFYLLRSRPPVLPPPVEVSLTQSNGPLRVFPFQNGGAFIVLQDGSLWEWGQGLGAPANKGTVPGRVGTNTDWVEVHGVFQHYVGRRNDGTIWEWGRRWNCGYVNEPQPVGGSRNWIAVDAGYGYGVALNADGTLWTWGENSICQLGIGKGPGHSELVQIGTNDDWTAISCQMHHTFGLRKDGTVWAWGQFWQSRFGRMAAQCPFPTQVCRNTNWASLAPDDRGWARTQTGELWELSTSPPDATADAGTTCRLVTSGPVSPQTGLGIRYGPTMDSTLYDVRADGTLWSAAFHPDAKDTVLPRDWHQVGKRTDWVVVWGNGTVFGLAKDGTLWTWGIDPGQAPEITFQARLERLGNQITGNANRPVSGMPAYQEEPRPLMRITVQPGK